MNSEDSSSNEILPSYLEQVSVVIRMLRALYSMSQTDLAQAAEVSRPTINRVETLRDAEKVRTATLEALLAVFRRLGVRLELTEEGLVMGLPIHSLMIAIEAVKDRDGKLALMESLLKARGDMLFSEGPTLSADDLERIRRAIRSNPPDEDDE